MKVKLIFFHLLSWYALIFTFKIISVIFLEACHCEVTAVSVVSVR